MGYDMWLPSVCDEIALAKAAINNGYTDAPRDVRGFYCGTYTEGDLLAVLGISFLHRCDEHDGNMRPDKAKELLAELEARPVTRELIRCRLRGDNDDVPEEFLELTRMLAEAAPDVDVIAEDDADKIYKSLQEDWERLTYLLRLAVERNETLWVCG